MSHLTFVLKGTVVFLASGMTQNGQNKEWVSPDTVGGTRTGRYAAAGSCEPL